MNGDLEDRRNFAGEKIVLSEILSPPDKKFKTLTFEGNPEKTPLARNMNINIGGIPLAGVKSFKIRGGVSENNGLIEATVVLEANVLGLVAQGKIEGDPVEAGRVLAILAGPIPVDDLVATIGEATGEYPEWDAGERAVIEECLARRLAAKGNIG